MDFVQVLRRNGWDARLLVSDPHFSYRFHAQDIPVVFDPRCRRPVTVGQRLRKGGKDFLLGMRSGLRTESRSSSLAPDLDLRAEDIVIVPEFAMDWLAGQYPDNHKILLVQSIYGIVRPYMRNRSCAQDFAAAIVISEASRAAVEYILGISPHYVPLAINAPHQDAVRKKCMKIAYMPQRRPQEADYLVSLIKRSPACKDVEIVPIAGMTGEERDRVLRETLIFLSFSHQEGFGLPPAEAMAAGCIVIGYTGVGGEEFFTPETGFPILDDDIIAFARRVEEVVTEYRRDPVRLDALRARASQTIRVRYNAESRDAALLKAFERIVSSATRPGQSVGLGPDCVSATGEISIRG